MYISIIIPTRNRAKSLLRALRSVEEGFEIIVLDDASSPKNRVKNQKIAESGSFVYKYNLLREGAAKSRNIGALEASGEWLCFLDDDDQFAEEFFPKIQILMRTHPKVGAWLPNVLGGAQRSKKIAKQNEIYKRNQVGGCSGLLIRKALFTDLGGFDEKLDSMQDWDLWIRLIKEELLHYTGSVGVIYDSSSAGKITHDLKAKYQGLRRLFLKHYPMWPGSAKRYHIARLWALRQLLYMPSTGIYRCLVCCLSWPAAICYFIKWKKYLTKAN